MQTQFSHDVATVGFRSFDTKIEMARYLFCRLALSQQLHDFPLAGGQG